MQHDYQPLFSIPVSYSQARLKDNDIIPISPTQGVKITSSQRNQSPIHSLNKNSPINNISSPQDTQEKIRVIQCHFCNSFLLENQKGNHICKEISPSVFSFSTNVNEYLFEEQLFTNRRTSTSFNNRMERLEKISERKLAEKTASIRLNSSPKSSTPPSPSTSNTNLYHIYHDIFPKDSQSPEQILLNSKIKNRKSITKDSNILLNSNPLVLKEKKKSKKKSKKKKKKIKSIKSQKPNDKIQFLNHSNSLIELKTLDQNSEYEINNAIDSSSFYLSSNIHASSSMDTSSISNSSIILNNLNISQTYSEDDQKKENIKNSNNITQNLSIDLVFHLDEKNDSTILHNKSPLVTLQGNNSLYKQHKLKLKKINIKQERSDEMEGWSENALDIDDLNSASSNENDNFNSNPSVLNEKILGSRLAKYKSLMISPNENLNQINFFDNIQSTEDSNKIDVYKDNELNPYSLINIASINTKDKLKNSPQDKNSSPPKKLDISPSNQNKSSEEDEKKAQERVKELTKYLDELRKNQKEISTKIEQKSLKEKKHAIIQRQLSQKKLS